MHTVICSRWKLFKNMKHFRNGILPPHSTCLSYSTWNWGRGIRVFPKIHVRKGLSTSMLIENHFQAINIFFFWLNQLFLWETATSQLLCKSFVCKICVSRGSKISESEITGEAGREGRREKATGRFQPLPQFISQCFPSNNFNGIVGHFSKKFCRKLKIINYRLYKISLMLSDTRITAWSCHRVSGVLL